MKIKFKIGVVGAAAAVLVALGVFGFGSGSTGVKADIAAGNVYLLSEHQILPSSTGTQGILRTSCSDGPGALQVNTTNFPPAGGTFGFSTTTTTSQPTGLPLVEISNVSAANQVLNVTQPSVSPLFTNNNFIYICVNPTNLGAQTAANGINSGTINFQPVQGLGSGLNDGSVTFSAIVQSNMGFFDQPSCTDRNSDGVVGTWSTTNNVSDACANPLGSGTAQLTVPPGSGTDMNNLNTIIVRFSCVFYPLSTGLVFPITIQQDQGAFTFNVICKGEASATATTIKATPNTVEIIPARSNTSHSLILVTILDANGNPIIPGRDVDFRTDRCAIETSGLGLGTTTSSSTAVLGGFIANIPTLGTTADGPTVLSLGAALGLVSSLNTSAPGTYLSWEYSAVAQTGIDISGFGVNAFSPQADLGKVIDGFDFNANGVPDNSLAGAVLSCNPVQAAGVTPGTANVTACVAVLNGVDVCVATTVKVIGPPASITVAASPTSVVCGEKSTITATVVDAIGQSVSDHTRVELVTNLGGVIGGTGAVAGFAANVAPVSSSVADTFGGVATSFLITSDVTSGPYEVVATSGGTTSGDFAVTGSFPNGTQTLIPNVFVSNPNTLATIIAANPNAGLSANNPYVPLNLAGLGANNNGFGTGAFGLNGINVPITQTYLGGQFSTPPVSAQVTVNCALPTTPAAAVPAPAITAPRTGTGIVPPNTGDAGLASTSGSNWTLFALGSAIALTLAGLATVKFARR